MLGSGFSIEFGATAIRRICVDHKRAPQLIFKGSNDQLRLFLVDVEQKRESRRD